MGTLYTLFSSLAIAKLYFFYKQMIYIHMHIYDSIFVTKESPCFIPICSYPTGMLSIICAEK